MARFKAKHAFRKKWRAYRLLISNNVSLLLPVLLGCVGIWFGVWIFRILEQENRSVLSNFLYSPQTIQDFPTAATAVVSAFIGHLPYIAMLFLCGLTAFGSPLILLCTFLFGFRLGVTQSFVYLSSGLTDSVLYIAVPMIIAGIGIILAIKSALHMSFAFSKQLLPSSAHCGGLWTDFKQFISRCFIALAILFASAVTEVVFRLIRTMM